MTMEQKIPQTIEIEHEELHEELAKAMRVGGRTGEAARRVMKILQAHMARESALVRPALALLAPLAAGRIPPDADAHIERGEALRAEMPRMVEEHQMIVEALRELMRSAAEEQQHQGYAHFAQKLIAHAQSEEEVLYPAALLVGEYLKARLKPS